MTDESDIIRQLRKEEELGLLGSNAESTPDLKFVKQPSGEIPHRSFDCIAPGTTDSTMDVTVCNILLDDIYKTAFDLSPDCIVILDLHGVVYVCNIVTEVKLGWKKEEIIGKHIFEIGVFRKDVAPERMKLFLAVLDGRDVESFESEILCRDGSSFFAEVRPILLKKDGEKIGVLAIWRDITKNKKINQILHRYEKIIKTIKHPMSLIDTNYVYQTVNDAYLLFLQKSRQEIEGHLVEEVLGKDFFVKQVKPYIDRCLAGEEVRYQVSFITPNKEKKILEVEAYPYFDSDGTISGVVAHTIDLTERKKMENALKKSDERFRQITESADEWIWETDARGLYTYTSPVVEKILGYKPEELIGKKYFYDFFAPDIKEELKKAALEIFAKKKPLKNIFNPNIHKNGTVVLLETNGMPILDHNGNLLGYRGADTDITERKTSEQQLNDQLRELERYKKITVGREHQMINLKKEINELYEKLGEKPRYVITSEIKQ